MAPAVCQDEPADPANLRPHCAVRDPACASARAPDPAGTENAPSPPLVRPSCECNDAIGPPFGHLEIPPDWAASIGVNRWRVQHCSKRGGVGDHLRLRGHVTFCDRFVVRFHGGIMLKLAIVTVMLCFVSSISAAATTAEDQANSFIRLYSTLCLKHVNNLEALRDKLRPMPKLPPEKAEHFLAGRAGDVWPVPDKSGTFVLALLKGKSFCAVYARRADTDAAEQRFSAIVATAPSPLVAKQVTNEHVQTSANGQTHTVSYEWSIPNAHRKMLFTLTTASSATAQIQALGSAAIISQ